MSIGINGVLAGVFVVCVTYLFLSTVGMSSKGAAPAKNREGKSIMKYSSGILFLCGITALLILNFSFMMFHEIPTNPTLTSIPMRLFVVFFGLACAILWFYFFKEVMFVKVQFDNSSFRKFSRWYSNEMQWKEVVKVTYNNSLHDFLFEDGTKRIRISQYMTGVIEFLRVVDYNVKAAALVDIRNDLDLFLSE